MVVTLKGGCRVSAMRDGNPLRNETLSIWTRIGRATGAQSISFRVLEFARGRSPEVQNGHCDEVLYVLDQGSTTDAIELSIDGRAYEVGPDTGIFVRPQQAFAVDNPGPDPVVILSSQCPDPAQSSEFVSAEPSSNVALPAIPPIVRLADRRAQPTADRWYRVLVDDEVGSIQVTQFVGSIPPGRAPDHFHTYEEVLFILKGEGRMWAGETSTPIAPGACIYLPKGQLHCVENTGAGEL
ncbi:MAG TPA: cupin domain-containing protein, partial [Pyrinomonadaceae bacterium]